MAHYFANVLYLSICMLRNCSCFYFRLLTFFKIKFLNINHPGPPSECQTVWIQIKTDIVLVIIWVQTVCKRLLADDKIIHWHAKSYEGCSNMNASSFITFFAYMLRQNGKRFYKGLYVTFKLAPDLKKNTVYLSSYNPLNEGHVSILTNNASNIYQ